MPRKTRLATRSSHYGNAAAPKSSAFKTVEKFVLDAQHNARLLGHAAKIGAWEIAISVAVHIDNLPSRIEKAYAFAAALPEPARTHMRKALHRLYLGYQTAQQAVRGAPPHGARDPHAHRDAGKLRLGALEMYSAAGDIYSLMHHMRNPGWGGVPRYLAAQHEFKRSLRRDRKRASRNLRAWPSHA